jgi:hypothetical protein
MCHLCIDPSANPEHTLTYGRLIGLGDTEEEAVEQWHRRMMEWSTENPECRTWPRPHILSPEGEAQVVIRLTWAPKQFHRDENATPLAAGA